MEQINVCLSPDNKYVKPCIATIQSLCINNCDDVFVQIYILDGGLNKTNKSALQEIVSYHKNASIEFVEVDDSVFKEFYTNNWGTAATYRFKIGQLLKKIDRVLYIDSDTIIRRSIKGLYNIDLDDNVMAMVPDIWSKKQKKRFTSKRQPYFNTGVCLFDLKKWREEKIDIKLMEFYRKNVNNCHFPDQDPINVVLDGRIFELEYKYNFCWHWDRNDYFIDHGEISVEEAVIVHYIFNKPWWSTCIHPYANFYWEIVQGLPGRLKNFCVGIQKQKINSVKLRLFGIVPLLKIDNYMSEKHYRLFGLIPLFKVIKRENFIYYYAMNLLVAKMVCNKVVADPSDVAFVKDAIKY